MTAHTVSAVPVFELSDERFDLAHRLHTHARHAAATSDRTAAVFAAAGFRVVNANINIYCVTANTAAVDRFNELPESSLGNAANWVRDYQRFCDFAQMPAWFGIDRVDVVDNTTVTVTAFDTQLSVRVEPFDSGKNVGDVFYEMCQDIADFLRDELFGGNLDGGDDELMPALVGVALDPDQNGRNQEVARDAFRAMFADTYTIVPDMAVVERFLTMPESDRGDFAAKANAYTRFATFCDTPGWSGSGQINVKGQFTVNATFDGNYVEVGQTHALAATSDGSLDSLPADTALKLLGDAVTRWVLTRTGCTV